MLKTITITAYNRADYLRRVLDSLRESLTVPGVSDDYTVVFNVEPGDAEVLRVCREFNRLPATVRVHGRRLGVKDNPFDVLRYVFESMRADINLYLEDDVQLGLDAMRLVDWYAQSEQINHCLSLQLCNYDSTTVLPTAIVEHPRGWQANTYDAFNAIGFVLTARSWYESFKPWWYSDVRGWDWAIRSNAANAGSRMLIPMLSRATHIGRDGGVFQTREEFDARWAAHPVSQTVWPGAFEVVSPSR